MQKLLIFLNKNKFIMIIAAAIVAALVVAFLMGGNIGKESPKSATVSSAVQMITAESTKETATTASKTIATTDSDETSTAVTTTAEPSTAEYTITEQPQMTEAQEETQPVTDKYRTEPTPTDKPAPVEPQEQTTVDNTLTCTLSITCQTALQSADLEEEIREILPSDGILLPPCRIEFTEGESAYDLLLRTCREKKIHLDATFTPIYNSCYIKGIGNLYEFDCGENSGWMYKVNDWFPNYGMSRYVLKNGDTVSLIYTCDGGFDIGERQ